MRTPTKGDDSGDPKASGCRVGRVVRLNVLGVPYASHAAVDHMLDRGSGDVVIVSSLAGRRIPKADGTVYAATNHALTAVAKGLRMDVSARGVRIINVAPGLVRTEFPEGSFRSADQYYAEKEYFTIEGKDVGVTVLYAVEQPPHVSVSEILVRPTEQLK